MNLTLPVIFVAGLATFLTPCVLPLIPIYLGSLAGSAVEEAEQTVSGRLRVLKGALVFVAGFTLVFVALGLASTFVGKALAAHKILLMQIGGLLVFLFGLKFLGVLKIDWLDRELRFKGPGSGSVWGNLAFGIVFALGWTPCIGPILGSVLTYTASTTSDPLKGALYLLAYAGGFALPLLAVAVLLSAATRLTDKIKKHMRKVEVVGGSALVLVGVLLVTGKVALLTGASVPGGRVKTPVCEPREKLATVLQFKSATCKICAAMEPAMAQLKQDCSGKKVHIRQVDLTDPANTGLSRKHRVIGVPTFLFLDKKGKEVARLVGRQSLSTLRQHMSLLTGESCSAVGEVPGAAPRTVKPAPETRAPPPAVGGTPPGAGDQACTEGKKGEGRGALCTKW